jgi:hypothetical protein
MAVVRAKFKVDSIQRTMSSRAVKNEDGTTRYEPCEMRTIVMTPVHGGNDPDHENAKFWQYTPSGRVELGCVNLAAAEVFELGEEYYIDFTPAGDTELEKTRVILEEAQRRVKQSDKSL